MNPIIILGAILAGVLLWFILSFIFPWIGSVLIKMYKAAIKNINKTEKEDKDNEKR